MAKRELTPYDIRLIEELAAIGCSVKDIAEELSLAPKTFSDLAANDLAVRGSLNRGQERYNVNGDQIRRERLDQASRHFVPQKSDYEQVRELARLGWHEHKIAKDALNITFLTWMSAKKAFPELAKALKEGQAESNGRRLQDQIREWCPTPDDLIKIESLASQGKSLTFIARALGLNVSTLSKRKKDLPEVEEAYMRGLAQDEELVASALRNNALKKNNVIAQKFYLSHKHAWTDRIAPAEVAASQEPPKTVGKLAVPMPNDQAFKKSAVNVEKNRLKKLDGLKAVVPDASQ